MHVTLRCNAISGLCSGAAFAMRERNETPFVHALKQLHKRNRPTGRNQLGATQLDAADWLVWAALVGCIQLSLTRLKAFKHN